MARFYPPLVSSYMPAFDYTKAVRIYFSISSFNAAADIMQGQAQVTVRYQSNNTNALDTDLYPNKIKCVPVQKLQASEDATLSQTAASYYVELSPDDIINGFDPNTIYKVQIRFSSNVWSTTLPQTTPIAQLALNTSEWSTVCLLKPIEIPTLGIAEFDNEIMDNVVDNTIYTYTSLEPVFNGVYNPIQNSKGTETLKTWRMWLTDKTGEQVLADSGEQMVNTYEFSQGRFVFEYQMPYEMHNNTTYILNASIETKNGYTTSIQRIFTAKANASAALNGKVELTINEEDGYAEVVVKATADSIGTNITLRRTSSESQFTIWEDVANYTTVDSAINWEFDDFTIKSGIFYQYAAQKRDNRGRRSSAIYSAQEMGEFDDAFLVERGGSLSDVIQLKLRYDVTIQNAAINIGESKTDTIGSKYPYIRRNGNMYYHSFPLSGLITAYMDNNHLFATENELRDYSTDLYKIAYGSNILSVETGKYDYTYERAFREKVKTFLYDNKPKLFKSLTEGNLLIKLMNITLTPKQELGRLIYSFDATAVEIDEATITNLNDYGIQTIGTYQENILWDEKLLGQLNQYHTDFENNTIEEDAYPAGYDIISGRNSSNDIGTFENIYQKYHYGEIYNGTVVRNFEIDYLRIEIESDPYLIKNVGGRLYPIDDISDNRLHDNKFPTTQGKIDDNVILGTIIEINGKQIVIEPPNNIYEIKGDNVSIGPSWKIIPAKDTRMLIDYNIKLRKEKDNSRIATSMTYDTKFGQFFGIFAPFESLWTKIWYKYFIDLYGIKNLTGNTRPYYINVTALKTLNVQAEPNTILYIQTKADEDGEYHKLIIDETGELFIDPGEDQSVITDAYFYGISIENRMLNGGGGMSGTTQPVNAVQYSAYNDGTPHIFYNNQWYDAKYNQDTDTYDIQCIVDGIVDYTVEIEKGVY